MLCDYDVPHAPTWCDACWEAEQKAKDREIQRNILKEMRKSADERELERQERGIYRPQRPYNVPKEISVTQTVPEIRRRGL